MNRRWDVKSSKERKGKIPDRRVRQDDGEEVNVVVVERGRNGENGHKHVALTAIEVVGSFNPLVSEFGRLYPVSGHTLFGH